LTGILNGADYAVWNPEKDKLIAARYSARDFSGKLACKKNLLEVFGLPQESLDKPLIGIVSRFAGQKGFDLIEEIALRADLDTWRLAMLEEDGPTRLIHYHRIYEGEARGSVEAFMERLRELDRLKRACPSRGARLGRGHLTILPAPRERPHHHAVTGDTGAYVDMHSKPM